MTMSFVDTVLAEFENRSQLEELFINGVLATSFLEQSQLKNCKSHFTNIAEATHQVQEFAHGQLQRLDPIHPFAGGMYQGYRWHCVINPVARFGPLFVMRRMPQKGFLLDAFLGHAQYEAQLKNVMLGDGNILVCGATGSGKTSFLISLLREYWYQERVCIIEDVDEIPLASPAWFKLLCQPKQINYDRQIGFQQLLAEALRLRPSKLVVGEIRTPDSMVYLEAQLTGHGGCLGTLHCGNKDQAYERLNMLQAQSPYKKNSWLKKLNLIFLTSNTESKQINEVAFVA